jgi:hypothetical protein
VTELCEGGEIVPGRPGLGYQRSVETVHANYDQIHVFARRASAAEWRAPLRASLLRGPSAASRVSPRGGVPPRLLRSTRTTDIY